MTRITIANVDAWAFIKTLPDQSIGAIITDPNYDDRVDMDELRRVCRGNIVMFCSPKNRFFEPDEIAYWIKPTSTKNNSKHLSNFVEEIIIERRGDTFNSDLDWANYTGVYYDIILEKRVHPYQKPLSLLERLILIYTNPGDIILDPFFGSGVTLIAARNKERYAFGCDWNAYYFDEFVSRHPSQDIEVLEHEPATV